jgi:hypothetical protein
VSTYSKVKKVTDDDGREIEIRINYYTTSDRVSLEIDGKQLLNLYDEVWWAILELDQE